MISKVTLRLTWCYRVGASHHLLNTKSWKKENIANKKCWSFPEPIFKMTPHFKFVGVLDSSWMSGCWQKLAHLKHKSIERWSWFPFGSLRDRIRDNFWAYRQTGVPSFGDWPRVTLLLCFTLQVVNISESLIPKLPQLSVPAPACPSCQGQACNPQSLPSPPLEYTFITSTQSMYHLRQYDYNHSGIVAKGVKISTDQFFPQKI